MARASVSSNAWAIRAPRRIGPCALATAAIGSDGGRSDVRREPGPVSTHSSQGVFHWFMAANVPAYRSGSTSSASRTGALHQRSERVDGPEHPRGGVEEAARRRRVEERRTHQVQRAVAGVERVAGIEPAHPVEGQLDVAAEPGGHRPVRRPAWPAGTASRTVSRLPMWSWSSWDMNTQRTSCGSTTEKTVGEPLVADERAAGVDDHRLAAADDEAVGGEEGPTRVGGDRRDEERVGGDAVGSGGQDLERHGDRPFSIEATCIGLNKTGFKQTTCNVKPMPTKSPNHRSPAKRSYNSSRRHLQAAQTRDEVIRAAAVALFSGQRLVGHHARRDRRAAGVVVETIYNGFGSKKALLRAAMETAVVGDTEPIPYVERPEFLDLGMGDARRAHHPGVDLVTEIHERSAGVWQAIVRQPSARRRGRRLAARARARAPQRLQAQPRAHPGGPSTTSSSTMIWILYRPETYLKLVADSGMSPRRVRGVPRRRVETTHRLVARRATPAASARSG